MHKIVFWNISGMMNAFSLFTPLLLGHSRSTHLFGMLFWYQWRYFLLSCMRNITPGGSSDFDQKSIIDHFRLIGWKTIDFFQSRNFDHRFLITQFWNNQFFFQLFPNFFYQWICQMATCNMPKAKRKNNDIRFSIWLFDISLYQFF